MGPDSGMAAAIGIVMLLMVAGGFTLFVLVGRAIARTRGAEPRKAMRIGLLAGVLGLGAGYLLVIATFYESTWSPPPTVRFALAKGADPEWIMLLEDPVRGKRLQWSGIEAPFIGISTEVAVPPGGVVRVASLDKLSGRGDARAVWPDGTQSTGGGFGSAPEALGGRVYAAWTRRGWEEPATDLPSDEALVAWVRARE